MSCPFPVRMFRVTGRADRDVTAEHFDVVSFTLICSEETPPHPGDVVIRTDGKTVEEITNEMRRTIDGFV